MADHRNLNTSKYQEDWFLDLSKEAKLFYYYLIEHVNKGGFFNISYRKITYEIDFSEEETKQVMEELKDEIILSDDNKIIYLKRFMQEQHNLPMKIHDNYVKGFLTALESKLSEFSKSKKYFLELKCLNKSKNSFEEITIGEVLSYKLGNNNDLIPTTGCIEKENDCKEGDSLPF